jgi:hypothetical protein
MTSLASIASVLTLGINTVAVAGVGPECGPPGGPNWRPRRGATPVYEAGFAGTIGPYASAGAIVGWKPARCNRCALGAISSGWLAQGTVGLDGVRAGIGRASRNPLMGTGARMSVEHTWRRKGDVAAGNTFLGPEIRVGLGPVTAWTGILWRVDGPTTTDRRWSWGIAAGF